jgi:hypothetical protein
MPSQSSMSFASSLTSSSSSSSSIPVSRSVSSPSFTKLDSSNSNDSSDCSYNSQNSMNSNSSLNSSTSTSTTASTSTSMRSMKKQQQQQQRSIFRVCTVRLPAILTFVLLVSSFVSMFVFVRMTTEITMSTKAMTLSDGGAIPNHPWELLERTTTTTTTTTMRRMETHDIDTDIDIANVPSTGNTIHHNHQHHHNYYWQEKETKDEKSKYRYKLGLVRSVGNALPPRHDTNQTLRNLEFLLRHEPTFESSVHKHWILNRIVDNNLLQQLENLLHLYNQSITILPFEIQQYESIPYQYHKANKKVLGSNGWTNNVDLIRKESFWMDTDQESERKRREYLDELYNNKNLYVTNQNNARNYGINYYSNTKNYNNKYSNNNNYNNNNDVPVVDYILPWDGNCFLTQTGHDLLHQELEHQNDEQQQRRLAHAAKSVFASRTSIGTTIFSNTNSTTIHDGGVDAAAADTKMMNYNAPIKYFYTPMDRITDKNEVLLDPDTYKPNLKEEPQIVLHRTAIARFNPKLRYGLKNKVDLLQKLQINGSWNKPNITYKRPKDYNYYYDPHQDDAITIFGATNDTTTSSITKTPGVGWVTRLFSGKANLEGYNLATARGNARTEGMAILCQNLDVKAVVELHYDGFNGYVDDGDDNSSSNDNGSNNKSLTTTTTKMRIAPYLFYDENVLQKEADDYKKNYRSIDEDGDGDTTPFRKLVVRLIEVAESSLRVGPWSVVDKQRCGCPYNKCNEYYNVKPYPWPATSATTTDETVAVTIEDEKTNITANGCDDARYDRRRLAEFFSNTTVLGLAYSLTGNVNYASKAADNIRTWFLNPNTRMNPRLKDSRISWNGQTNTYFSKFSVLDFKDVYFFLDAIRMIEKSGELSNEDRVGIRIWFRQYLEWFTHPGKKFGKGAYYDDDHNGLYYDIQLISIASFTGNLSLAVKTAHESVSRLNGHVDKLGRLKKEIINGPILCEYNQMFTLQGWITLSRLVSNMGINLWKELPIKSGTKTGQWADSSKLCQAAEYSVPLLRDRKSCDPNTIILDDNNHSSSEEEEDSHITMATATIQKRDDTQWWPIHWFAQWNCPKLKIPYPFFHQAEWISNIGRSPPDSHYGMEPMYDFSSVEYEDSGIAPFWNLGLL